VDRQVVVLMVDSPFSPAMDTVEWEALLLADPGGKQTIKSWFLAP